MLITSTSSVAGFVQAGRMRALAVTSPRRLGVFAKVPTLEELGYRNLRFEDWYGIFVPAGTPPERVAHLNRALVQVLHQPDVVRQINEGGSDVVASSPEAFGAQLKSDISRWSQIVKLSGAHRIEDPRRHGPCEAIAGAAPRPPVRTCAGRLRPPLPPVHSEGQP